MPQILRYAAFANRPDHGNPAGLVLDARGLSATAMQALAAEVGFSETAFLVGRTDLPDTFDIRYFTPAAEVAFCGHATIAAAVALAERGAPPELALHTRSNGIVRVEVRADDAGRPLATLTSPAPRVEAIAPEDLDEALAALGWKRTQLDPALPPRVAFAGERHLVLAAGTRARLAALDYDYDRLAALMGARGWTTLQLVWRERPRRFHSRNPGPGVGIVEDPATGAAAAALGAYLRTLGLVDTPARVEIRQGEDIGRPSRLVIDIGVGEGGIAVSGTAVPMAAG